MSFARAIRNWCLPAAMMLMLGNSALAVQMHQDCRTPLVFEGAAVNVVVLPYRYAGGSNASLTNMGNRLSLLVKLDVLSHILGYGSVGAVQMEMPEFVSKDDPSCQPEIVLPKLLGTVPGAMQKLAPGHGLVLVWGLLYEDGDDIFVQTYARFLRRDVDEGVTFTAGGSSFSAKPSAQLLAFTPQKFSQQQLAEVENSYRKADFIRTEPSDSAPGEPLPDLVAKCASCDDSAVHAGFYVEEIKGEWIRVQRMDPVRGQNKEGWIHAAGGLEGVPLEKILPELKFIEGCAGYLRQRVADAQHTPLPGEMPALAVASLNAFAQSNDAQPADITNAVALQLAGIVEYLSAQDRVDSFTRAAQDFERARKMIPYDPNAINLAVGAQVKQEWKQKGKCDQTALKAQRLSAASMLSPDKAALGNLNSLYTLLLKSPDETVVAGNLSKGDVANRLSAVDGLTRDRSVAVDLPAQAQRPAPGDRPAQVH
jgi:hypothetical protein